VQFQRQDMIGMTLMPVSSDEAMKEDEEQVEHINGGRRGR